MERDSFEFQRDPLKNGGQKYLCKGSKSQGVHQRFLLRTQFHQLSVVSVWKPIRTIPFLPWGMMTTTCATIGAHLRPCDCKPWCLGRRLVCFTATSKSTPVLSKPNTRDSTSPFRVTDAIPCQGLLALALHALHASVWGAKWAGAGRTWQGGLVRGRRTFQEFLFFGVLVSSSFLGPCKLSLHW